MVVLYHCIQNIFYMYIHPVNKFLHCIEHYYANRNIERSNNFQRNLSEQT